MPSRRIAIDDKTRFQASILKVRVGIAYLRERFDAIEHHRGPFLNVLYRVALDGVLELRIAASPSNANFLSRLEEKA